MMTGIDLNKYKYLVKMNWYGEVHKIYTSSYSNYGAFENACHQLAKRVGYTKAFVKSKFSGKKDNYEIVEREWCLWNNITS